MNKSNVYRTKNYSKWYKKDKKVLSQNPKYYRKSKRKSTDNIIINVLCPCCGQSSGSKNSKKSNKTRDYFGKKGMKKAMKGHDRDMIDFFFPFKSPYSKKNKGFKLF
jgi:hypothetical protein